MKSFICPLLCGVCLVVSSITSVAKPRAAPLPAPPEQPAPEVKQSRGLFDFLKHKQAEPAPAPPPAEKPKTKLKKNAQPEPPPPPPEPKGSKGLFGFLKRKPAPAPEPMAPAKPGKPSAKPPAQDAKMAQAEEKKPGFFGRIFGSKSKSSEEEIAPDDRPPRPTDWEKKHIVKEQDVAAYAYGPSQSRDAEAYLAKGAIVTVKRSGKFWTEITTEQGRNFTVGTDQIRKAEASDFAPPTVIASASGGADIVPMPDYEPSLPANLPETTPQRNLDLPDLLLPPLPPP